MSDPGKGRPVHFVAWLIGERLIRGLVTVVALAAVARHLQPAGFGVLNFANSVVSLVVPLAQLGLDTVLVRELVRNPSRTGSLLGTSFAIRLVSGVCLAAALFGLSHVSTVIGSAQPALGPLCLILIAQAGEVSDCWFRSRVQSRTVVVLRGSLIVAGAGVKLALVAAGAGLVAFAWVYTAEAGAFALGLVICSSRGRDRAPSWSFNASLAWRLMGEGWGFALAGFLGALSVRADQIAVAGSLGDAAAGLYFGALRVMEIPIFVATSAAAALFPALAVAEDVDAMHVRLETVFGLMSAIAWITAIGATLAGPWLIPTLLGGAYGDAWPVFAIHGWAALFYFSGMVRANYLALRSAPGSQAAAAAATLAIQVVLNYILVPRFGISGAAMAFLATQVLSAYFLPLALPSLRPCLRPQLRSLFAPWQPRRWREFMAAANS
ncbi:MAG TPA: flippase [Opitutaceae bacterium]|nr:flippase [Opitutaceae bacterium]